MRDLFRIAGVLFSSGTDMHSVVFTRTWIPQSVTPVTFSCLEAQPIWPGNPLHVQRLFQDCYQGLVIC